MNDDLISRSALKQAMMYKLGLYDEENGANADYMEALEDCAKLIDKALTVEPTFGLFKEMLCEECGKRPHGEWIEFKGGYYKCDKCGEVERAKKNFCSKCGVDMRVKDELKREENKL